MIDEIVSKYMVKEADEVVKLSWTGGIPAKRTKTITNNHKPLIFKGVLVSVYAVRPNGDVTYCGHDYAKARKTIQEDLYTDFRVCKAPRNFNFPGDPHSVDKGQACLFGVPK